MYPRVLVSAIASLPMMSTVGDATEPASEFKQVALNPALLSSYEGCYRIDSNRFVLIATDGDFIGFTASEPARIGELVPLSERRFVSGPSPYEIEATIVPGSDGEVLGLDWRMGSAPMQRATRVAHRREELRFRNGDVTLAGSLILPATPGPHPAVVLIHGSGPAMRGEWGGIPFLFASLGVAALTYDKRGSGESTGKYHDWLPIGTLAADALAGVKELSERKDIDARRIGLYGSSQGGWVAPCAASLSSDVSFLIVRSGSCLPTWDNRLYEIENELRGAGFTEDELARARALGQLFGRLIQDPNANWSAARQAFDAARNEKWFEPAGLPGPLPETPAAPNLAWLERLRGYLFDPAPIWEAIRIPMVAFYGGRDRNVPGRRSAEILERALQKARNEDHTIHLYPEADHGMRIVTLDTSAPSSQQAPWCRDLALWVRKHAKVP